MAAQQAGTVPGANSGLLGSFGLNLAHWLGAEACRAAWDRVGVTGSHPG